MCKNSIFFSGYAAKQILAHEFGAGYEHECKVIFAGDDNTDEDIMKV
jgi:trehalose-6-phosphatase